MNQGRGCVAYQQIGACVWVCFAFLAVVCSSLLPSNTTASFSLVDTAPDCALLLLLLTCCGVVARWHCRVGTWLAVGISALWMVVIASQTQFLSISGSFATGALIRYAIVNVADVSLVAELGVQPGILAVLVLSLSAILSIMVIGPHRIERSAPWLLGATKAAAALVVAAAFAYPSTGGAIVGPLLSNRGEASLPWVDRASLQPYGFKLEEQPKETPDIIVWVLESTRADVLDDASRSPFLNALSKESAVYSRSYTTTTHTSKSLFGILCGRPPVTSMTIIEARPNRYVSCLPTALSASGYRTIFLQTALGEFEDRKDLASNLGFQEVVTQEDLQSERFKAAGFWAMDESAAIPVMVEAVQKKDGRPLFLTFLTSMTHAPYALPGDKEPKEPWPDAYGKVVLRTDEALQRAYAEIGKHLDWQNTILIVVGDHGEAFGEHGQNQHDQVPYEEGIKVPLMIHSPGRLEAGQDQELRQTVDILPTVLDLIGARWSGNLAGRSLLEEGHEHIVTSCWETMTCHSYLRADGMKVIFRFGQDPESVFDLTSDPEERIDLSAQHASLIDEAKLATAVSRAKADLWR